jgi:anti-anti-sigma regulatory factor
MGVSIDFRKNALIIHTDQMSVNEEEAKTCAEAIDKDNGQHKIVVLDFVGVNSINLKGLRSLSIAAERLRKSHFQVLLVSQKDVLGMIRERGLERLFTCVLNTELTGM